MEILIIFCWVISILLAGMFFLRTLYKAFGSGQEKIAGAKCISDKKNVTLLYTMLDTNGQILDSKYQKEPFTYLHGKGELLAGFEKRLTGLSVGIKKKITVPIKEAYGKKNPDNIKEVEKPNVPDEALKVGTNIIIKEIGDGKEAGTILEVKEDTLVLDYNHPLSGMKLVYDVEILDVQEVDVQKEEVVVKQGKEGSILRISDGMTVTIKLTMFDAKGAPVEQPNDGNITYVHGTEESFSQVIAGLQKKLVGLTIEKSAKILLSPDEAYGKIDPDAFQEVAKEEIFTDNLKVDAVLKGIGPDGNDARIDKINESTVILDFNHPLAGKSISCNVKIIDIKK